MKIGKKIRKKLKWLFVALPALLVGALLLLLSGDKPSPKDDLFEDKK